MPRHERPTRRPLPASTPVKVAVVLAVLAAIVAAVALTGGTDPVPAPPSAAVAPVAPPASPPTSPVHEHHIQQAASVPVDEAANTALAQVTRDRQAAAGVEAARATQGRLDAASGGALAFAPDTATLTDEGRDRLTQVAAVLRADPGARVEVVGHTAVEITQPALCLQLSQLRAAEVRSQLAAAGVPIDRLTAVGVSHSAPHDDAASSRRVELVALA